MSSKTYRQALLEAMEYALESFSNTVILGQGVTDHKGTFGTTLGLAERFPGRVIETPIAEDSIAGVSIGMALNGVYPINTHIRADFGILAFNQLINLAAKYKYMFGGLFEVPMMVRMVVGRSWGQGAQHSQSLQSLLSHIPGLTVVMPATPRAIESAYRYAVHEHKGPVVMMEHRLLYELTFSQEEADNTHPIFGSRLDREGSDVTVVAASIMLVEARRCAEYLASFDISVEIIDLHSVSHFDTVMVVESARKTGAVLVLDSSWPQFGIAAEISRVLAEGSPGIASLRFRSLGMANSPCPTAKSLEDIFYPDQHVIVRAVLSLLGLESGSIPLPEAQSVIDFTKKFRGPF